MATLLEQCGGSTAVGNAVLDEFLNQVPADTTEMEENMASGNLLQVSKAGHRLKGTAGVLGASELHKLCFAIELAGKENKSAEVAEVYPKLKAEAQRCVDAVPAAIQKLG
ncbi:MAG: Hpt domain-containing protein [Planctomycetaceae bacterium]|jgi:HPt (histidine-containing phosphotransfer) domain-containing protein|nr:Hpt domain-containing protein [Planctomycetaceae bacterium]